MGVLEIKLGQLIMLLWISYLASVCTAAVCTLQPNNTVLSMPRCWFTVWRTCSTGVIWFKHSNLQSQYKNTYYLIMDSQNSIKKKFQNWFHKQQQLGRGSRVKGVTWQEPWRRKYLSVGIWGESLQRAPVDGLGVSGNTADLCGSYTMKHEACRQQVGGIWRADELRE